MGSWRTRTRAAIAGMAIVLMPTTALAHMPAGGSALYGGLAHALGDLLQLCVLAAAGLYAGMGDERRLLMGLGAVLAGLIAGGLVALIGLPALAVSLFLTLAVLGLGALAAANRTLSPAGDGAVLAGAGLALGIANTGALPTGWSPLAYFAGVLLASLFAANLAAQLSWRATTPLRVVIRRVVGSWLAAVGLIVTMLALGPR